MLRLNRTVSLFCVVAVAAVGLAGAAGPTLAVFNESFDGTGGHRTLGVELSGLDTTDWSVAVAGGGEARLADGVLRLDNPGTRGGSFALLSHYIGTGSFEETLRLKNVQLGAPDSAPGTATAQMIWVHATDAASSFQLMLSDDGGGSGFWTVAVMQEGAAVRDADKRLAQVKAGKNIALRTVYDQSTQKVRFLYNQDATAAQEFVTVAEFVHKGFPMRTGSTTFMVQRGVEGPGKASVDIDSWDLAERAD